MKLPGVGENAATAIIGTRPFGEIDDPGQVHGIGTARLDKTRLFLTITPP